jgi:TonB family protein
VSVASLRRCVIAGFLAACALGAVNSVLQPRQAFAQEVELARKVKTKVAPIYPDIARRMNIAGTVKVVVVVAPNGSLKSTKVLGGHPLLVTAAVDALKKWKFESATQESTGVVEFKFKTEE